MTFKTPSRRPRLPAPGIAREGLRVVAVAARILTISVLTPVVLLFGVAAFVALAVVGTLRLAQSSVAFSSAQHRAAGADVRYLSSATPDRVESVAVRQAA